MGRGWAGWLRRGSRRGSLTRWLWVAGALHVAAITALWRQLPALVPRASPHVPHATAGEPFWVELQTPTPLSEPGPAASGRPPSPDLTASALASSGLTDHRPASERVRVPHGGATALRAERAASDGAEAEPAPSDDPGVGHEADAVPRLSLHDLGVGPGNNPFRGSLAELPTERQLANQRLQQSLRADLARADQRHGLGPEGPVVEAVKGIVFASATAPNTTALLSVRTDAAGAVTLVEVLESDRDGDGWRRIADELARAMTGKRLRVPPRSNGVSFQVRVVSRLQLPSGADPGLAIDLFGIPIAKGGGERSTRLSILTPTLQEVVIPNSDGATTLMPNLAIVSLSGDVADIGRVARRLVTAYLVGMDLQGPPSISELPLSAPATP